MPFPVKKAAARLRRLLSRKYIASKFRKNPINSQVREFARRLADKRVPARETEFKPEILIPCYNHGKYLDGIVSSIASKRVPITIINDCSSDPTREIAQSLQRRHQVRYLENATNIRQHGSLNRAITESDNNLFIVVNADDYLVPNWIDYVLTSFAQSDIRLMGGGSLHFQNHVPEIEGFVSAMLGSIDYIPSGKLRLMGPKDALCFTHENSINMTMTGCSFLRSAWSFVDGFFCPDQRVCPTDDRDFQMRVCSFFDIGISDEISAFYRTNSSQGLALC